MTAGSMPLATEIFQEGLRIPPIKIVASGRRCDDVFRLLLANVRTPREREGDLTAQIAANRTGERRLLEIVGRYGAREAARYAACLQDYAERMVRLLLRQLPEGTYSASDCLDDDGIDPGPVRISARVTIRRGTLEVDFEGSSPQVRGSVNAVYAITMSAVYYVVRSLIAEPIPASSGVLRPIRIRTPRDSVVDASFPAAVCAGNVETSQRIVDVLLRALSRADPARIPAASSGTMNNLTVGGVDPRDRSLFSYYETVGGGMGGCASAPGDSGIHTHMTNTLNTPVEALEYAYPVRVRRYHLRRGSGGAGRYRGGDGIVRELELGCEADATLLGDRRLRSPWGVAGGRPGKPGRNRLVRAGRARRLASKTAVHLGAGDRIVIETPGGGGWGRPKGAR
jgi:N-methylhydantoinase B